MSIDNIPIIINSFNRLTCLKQAIAAYESKQLPNPIIIIDNGSSYGPLLEYYKTLSYEIIMLGRNLGHEALWKSGLYANRFNKGYFVYTDPDVVLIEECPSDIIHHMYNIMQRYPKFLKLGLGLKIDDLPDHFPNKEAVISWEKQFWDTQFEPGVYKADIDTTFALHDPRQRSAWARSFRTGHPYMARHTTWYLDPHNLPEDEIFYKNVDKTITHWSRTL
jgi:glycosyltransferase involved in cell wall biosynthesis